MPAVVLPGHSIEPPAVEEPDVSVYTPLAGPDNIERISRCPGSLSMESRFAEPDDIWSEFRLLAAMMLLKTAPSGDERQGLLLPYVDSITARMERLKTSGTVTMRVNERLPISTMTGEKNAVIVADAIMLAQQGDETLLEVDVIDFGTSYDEVAARAKLRMFGLAAAIKHESLNTFGSIVLRLHMPRLKAMRMEPVEYTVTLDSLISWGMRLYESAEMALQILDDGPATALNHLQAGEIQCPYPLQAKRSDELDRRAGRHQAGPSVAE